MHVISVRKVFQRNVPWTYILPQFMKEKKLSNVYIATVLFRKKATWKSTYQMFMNVRDNSNVKIVSSLTREKNI